MDGMGHDHHQTVSNPGSWMAHCHIAEHAASGMMFSFNVKRAGAA
jgi:FtsP/CotA-like multicopper oxidase with cupredoxin domain